jgi:hypothetical protein
MAKLTAAQERSIETVLYYLEKAQAFIDEDGTVIARKSQHATTTRHFEIPGEGAATSIAKDIGSELVCLQTGIDYLKNFVQFNSKNP